jgi:hypothetical protein
MSDFNDLPTVANDTHTEQPVGSPFLVIAPEVEQQLVMGSIALGTMVCLIVLLREIRLLVEACKL